MNSGSNTFGCLPRASANVEPLSTSSFTLTSTFLNEGFSCWAPRMSRHCTRGSPASIMVANWRVKTASSFWVTFFSPRPGIFISTLSPLFFRMLVGAICSRRSCARTNASFGASSSPETFAPPRFLPSHANFAIVASVAWRKGCYALRPAPDAPPCCMLESRFRNSSGSGLRPTASSRVISRRWRHAMSDWFIVCIPNLLCPTCICE